MHKVELDLTTNPAINMVYISLGTNDVDSGMQPDQVAHRLYDLASRLQHGYNLRYVFIESIINRCPKKFPGFAEKAKLVNDAIAQRIAQGRNQSIRLWRLHNMNNTQKPILQPDGVHLNWKGLGKHYRQVRGALLFAANH